MDDDNVDDVDNDDDNDGVQDDDDVDDEDDDDDVDDDDDDNASDSVGDENAKVGEQARADGRGRDVQQRRVGNVFQEGQTTVRISRRYFWGMKSI